MTETAPDTRPQVRLIAAVLVAAAAAGVALVAAVHGADLGHPALLVAAIAGFALVERFSINIQVRDQSIANTAVELVQVLALLWLPALGFVVAHSVGGLGIRREFPAVKNVVNAASIVLSAAVAALLAHGLGGGLVRTEPRTWWAVLAAITIASLLTVLVTSVVIRAATGARSRVGWPVLAVSVGVAAALASVSLGAVVLATVHRSAVVLALVPGVVVLVGMRSYVRHRSAAARFRTLYDLSLGLSRAPELELALSETVVEARAQLRSRGVDLEIRSPGPGGLELSVSVDEHEVVRSTPGAPAQDRATAAALLDDWVAGGPAEAVVTNDLTVVPVRAGAVVHGVLVAHGRPTGRIPFGESDRVALQALADHIGATLERGQLSHRLRTATADRDYLAFHDPLTGLGNRRWFVRELDELVATDVDVVTVALLNVRGFRQLNERVGQSVGDVALVTIAEELRAVLPADARLARLAGDEFAVAVVGDPGADLADQLAVRPRVELEDTAVELTVAAGIARWPGEVLQASGLLRSADLALAAARRDRGPAVVQYDAALELAASRRSRLAGDLRRALQRGELTLHYQPLVDLATTTVVAAEALARWEHPEFGRVPPDEFVGIAEETGDVGHLTRWVLREAALQAASWAAAGRRLEVGVNVSVVDLEHGELVPDVEAALAASGVDPALLVLEITETAAMQDRTVVDRTLDELAALGVQLAIDDFGTGHSSLAYLHALPVSEVKVDRAFVADIVHNAVSGTIVRAVTDLAATRGLVVVAEGIEDEATRARLLELGVGRGQGWYFGRPVPVDVFPFDVRRTEQPAG